MKRIFLAIALILLTGVDFSNAYAEDYLIGAVSTQRLLVESPQAEKVKAQLTKEFSPRNRKLIEDQKKIKELDDRLAKDGAIMSESEKSKLEREIVNLRRENKRNQDEYNEDFSFRRNEELRKAYEEIGEAINAVARERKLDLVLTTESGVAFLSSKIDITGVVLEYLKNQSQKPVANSK